MISVDDWAKLKENEKYLMLVKLNDKIDDLFNNFSRHVQLSDSCPHTNY